MGLIRAIVEPWQHEPRFGCRPAARIVGWMLGVKTDTEGIGTR
jgi:hypothetical protein